MSDYLANLAARTLRPESSAIQPRTRSSFEAYAEPDRIADQAPDSVEDPVAVQLSSDRAPADALRMRSFLAGDSENAGSTQSTVSERIAVSEQPSRAEPAAAASVALEPTRAAASGTQDPPAGVAAPSSLPPDPPPRRSEPLKRDPAEPSPTKTASRQPPPVVDPSIRPLAVISAQAEAPPPREMSDAPRLAGAGETAAPRPPPPPPVDSPAVPLRPALEPIATAPPLIAEARPRPEPSVEFLTNDDRVSRTRQPADLAPRELRTAEPRAEEVAAPAPAIRVTIGRLEVRSPRPPTPTVRKVAELRRPALSLDEYLRNRDSGRR